MSIDLRLGKNWGLRRMATPAGHFSMMAVDQRHQISNLIANKLGIGEADVCFADMAAVKRLIVEELSRHVSAVLLDPNYSLPAALGKLPARTGFLITLEDNRYEEEPGGRKSRLIRNWSVEKIKRAGGDGVKLLTWYRPDADPDTLEHQQSFVKHVGDECRRYDIALVLELLVYPFSESTHAAISHTALPELVLDSVREFVRPRYGVDLLKLESPVPGALLPVRDGSTAHMQAQSCFDAIGAICRDADIPWVMLSGGITSAQFVRVMEYAYAAGANGFLAGRAIWWDGLQHFPDLATIAAQLREQGSATLISLNALTLRAASRWHADYSMLEAIKSEEDLCALYA